MEVDVSDKLPRVIIVFERSGVPQYEAIFKQSILVLNFFTYICIPIPSTQRYIAPAVSKLHYNGYDGVSNHQITMVYSTVYSGDDQRKHQCSASLAFVRGSHRWPIMYPHKWPVTRKNVYIWWPHHDWSSSQVFCIGKCHLAVIAIATILVSCHPWVFICRECSSTMMTSSNGNFFHVTGHLCGEFPARRPVTRRFVVFFHIRLIKGWVNNGEAGDLRSHCAHYEVIVMHGDSSVLATSIIKCGMELVIQGWFYVCAQPTRDGVTL